VKKIRFVGLDVHAETTAVAVVETNGEVRSFGTIPNREESARKLVKKLGPPHQLRAGYEAGPTGYVLYWLLTSLGVQCDVVRTKRAAVEAHYEGESSPDLCDRLTPNSRGSSRRITIMWFRPANQTDQSSQKLPRPLLALPSNNFNNNSKAHECIADLTRSRHIRSMHARLRNQGSGSAWHVVGVQLVAFQRWFSDRDYSCAA
jgi:hypothetical protein